MLVIRVYTLSNGEVVDVILNKERSWKDSGSAKAVRREGELYRGPLEMFVTGCGDLTDDIDFLVHEAFNFGMEFERRLQKRSAARSRKSA